MRLSRLLPILLTLCFADAARAADPGAGLVIAKRWCAACHVVAPDQARGSADAPSFADIASRYDERSLANFLATPYPRMPSMSLSRPEISDLVSYIRTLGPRRTEPAPAEKDVKPGEPGRG